MSTTAAVGIVAPRTICQPRKIFDEVDIGSAMIHLQIEKGKKLFGKIDF